jgi:glycosyltransferase involved in cell wall biosynthesis
VWHCPWKGLFGHPYPRAADVREHVAWSDVVHTTTYTAAPVARSVSRKLGKPCILTVQECLGRSWFQLGENIIPSALFYIFERFVISRKYDAWHCISQATARDVTESGVPSTHVKPILLGVDSDLYHSPPAKRNPAELFQVDPSTRVILFFGRPGTTKGVFSWDIATQNLLNLYRSFFHEGEHQADSRGCNQKELHAELGIA